MALSLAGQTTADSPIPQNARDARKEAEKAEKSGDLLRAYALYAQAAALNPDDEGAWARSQAMRRQAILAGRLSPAELLSTAHRAPNAAPATEPTQLTAKELEEARQFREPVRLRPDPGLRSFDLRGDSRTVLQQVLELFGIETIFDADYQPLQNVRLRMQEVGFEEAVRALEAATNSFLVPASERFVLAARDSLNKRQELEHTVALTIPIPAPVTVQEAQEAARTVQQAMEIQKFQVDAARRIVLLRDRQSKAEPALALFQQLLHYRPEVQIELDFIESTEQRSTSYGLGLPGSFPVVWLGQSAGLETSIPAGILNFLAFGGGKTLFGIGVTGAEAFATMSETTTRVIFRTTLRSSDGQPVNFHLGDRFPILTAGFFGRVDQPGQVFTPPPTVTFEDLGLVLKITPRVHDLEQVSLSVEADFKVLTGQAVNGIPIISNRHYAASARLKANEWAVLGGILSSSEARVLTGLAGLSKIPAIGALFRRNERRTEERESILVLKPRVLTTPLSEHAYQQIWTGTETKPRTTF